MKCKVQHRFAFFLLPILVAALSPFGKGSLGLAAVLPVAGDLPDVAQYVNPLIGTGPSLAPNPVPGGRGGSVFPGAVAPFGMVQWSPDTPHGEPSGYGYADDRITGFSLTHFSGAGCANSGDLPFVATNDATVSTMIYKHENERAEAGYYGVKFDNGIRVELTATTRTGFGRFTYPTNGPGVLIVDGTRNGTYSKTKNTISMVGQDSISGSTDGGNFCNTNNRYTLYFAAKFDRPWASGTIKDGRLVLNFDPKLNPEVKMKVGISYVSVANAKLNLDSESPGMDFNAVRAAAKASWNEHLNKIQVSGGAENDVIKFYTALYHSLIPPNVYSDVNGEYMGFDKIVHNAGTRIQYANFSGWDIYRSQIQLLALLFPDRTSDILQSLVADANECGSFPKWSQNNEDVNVMVGDPGSIIIANGYAFGAKNFDTRRALAIMKKVGSTPGVRCNGATVLNALSDYLARGYISSVEWGPASTSLEYVTRDFAAAQFSRALGDDEQYRILRARSSYWQNVLHPDGGGLMQLRLADGSFQMPLAKPGEGSNKQYVEGNAEQYTWMVPHDARGLFDSLGGNAKVVKRLDKFFSNLNAGTDDPNFYMGNEPNFATPWMYNWAGAPARTADIVRRVIDEEFTALSGGLPGNDDLGATSSWYVWGALGMYPQIPGVAGLTLATPLFASTIIHRGDGLTLELSAPAAPARYIQGLSVNGQALRKPWIDLAALNRDVVMNYELGTVPSSWGTEPASAPPTYGPGEFADLNEAHNSYGISHDTQVNSVDFDGHGFSYSAEALSNAGLPSGSISYAGVDFPWSKAPLNNSIATGQTIRIANAIRGRKLAFLGSASNGPSKGTGSIRYTDGSNVEFSLEFSDWALGGDTGSLSPGNEIVLRTSYRNHTSGTSSQTSAYIFYAAVPVDTTRTIASITLPRTVTAGRMHVFSMAIIPN